MVKWWFWEKRMSEKNFFNQSGFFSHRICYILRSAYQSCIKFLLVNVNSYSRRIQSRHQHARLRILFSLNKRLSFDNKIICTRGLFFFTFNMVYVGRRGWNRKLKYLLWSYSFDYFVGKRFGDFHQRIGVNWRYVEFFVDEFTFGAVGICGWNVYESL